MPGQFRTLAMFLLMLVHTKTQNSFCSNSDSIPDCALRSRVDHQSLKKLVQVIFVPSGVPKRGNAGSGNMCLAPIGLWNKEPRDYFTWVLFSI